MKLSIRILLFCAGLYISFYGWGLLHEGVFAYTAGRFRETAYSPGTIAVGVVLCLLAFLPSAKWLYPRITTRKNHRNRLQRRRSE